MFHTVITPPTVEPLTVDELKDHCRVVGTAEDEYFATLGKAARQRVEFLTDRTMLETTYEAVLDKFPSPSCPIKLPRATPLQSVTSVIYTDSAGTPTTLPTSEYVVNTDYRPGRIVPAYGFNWPTFTPYPTGAVRVRYVAGNSISPITYPEEGLLHAIKLLVGAYYEYREAEIVPDKPGIQAIELKVGGFVSLVQGYQVSFPF